MAPLASVDELRRFTGASWTDEQTAQLVVDAASGQVRAYCGWEISTEANVEVVVDSVGGRVLTIPCLHVTAVHEVRVNGDPITDYTWSASGVLSRSGWPDGLRTVAVVYSGGYDPVPPELVAVVCGLAGRLSNPTGVASWSVGAQTVTFNTEAAPGLSTVERAVLDRYRLPSGS